MKFEEEYEVSEFIGKGSFGEVKKCVNKSTHEVFAVKEITFSNEADREKAVQEAKVCKLVDHPSIVRLQAVYQTDTCVLLVLEYLPGGDLFDGVVSRSSLSEKDACTCIRQVLKALRYLAKIGIVHRDLKPENLLLSEKSCDDRPPVIKLTDFGIAKQLQDGVIPVQCHGSGSPMYLAPETILESKIDCAVDMWACGVILYLLLVGYPPFWNEKPEFLLLSILQANYTFPSPYWDTVSEPAKDLIKKMLVIDPVERINASTALQHEWIRDPDEIPGSKLNRRNTLVRLTAFNARRKLRGVVLGLIARKRMTFNPSANVRRLTRRDSYVPDQDTDLESHVQQLMANENDKLSSIPEEPSRKERQYDVKAIKPQRSHTYRTSLQLDINPTKKDLRSIRSERRRRSQKRAKETAASQETG